MRDLINIVEASFFTKPKDYTYGHKLRIALGNKKSDTLVKLLQQYMPKFDPTEDLEWVKPRQRGVHKISAGRGDDVITLKRPNGEMFSLLGSGKSIQQLFNHAPGEKGDTSKNVGNLSEPVLSASVVAKIIKRGKNSIEDITPDDVKYVLNQALKGGDKPFIVKDLNSKIADTIKFTIQLSGPATEFIQSPKFWEVYEPLLPSIVHFANSGTIDRYADYFYKNGKVDTIWVKSDGLTEQKKKKTDIEAYVKDESGEIRPLKGLNISLKAGSSQIGQVGGGSLNPKATGYIYNNALNLFTPFGVTLPAPRAPITDKLDYWIKAYKTAGKQIKDMLMGADARKEAGIIFRIADLVTNHATLGDPNIRLVSLSKSGISILHSFKDLQKKLSDNNVNLDCIYREGLSRETNQPRPELRIYDKTSGRGLVYIRYTSLGDESKISNTIDMQDLLKHLTTIPYQKSKISPSQEPQPQEPQPENPKTVAPINPNSRAKRTEPNGRQTR